MRCIFGCIHWRAKATGSNCYFQSTRMLKTCYFTAVLARVKKTNWNAWYIYSLAIKVTSQFSQMRDTIADIKIHKSACVSNNNIGSTTTSTTGYACLLYAHAILLEGPASQNCHSVNSINNSWTTKAYCSRPGGPTKRNLHIASCTVYTKLWNKITELANNLFYAHLENMHKLI